MRLRPDLVRHSLDCGNWSCVFVVEKGFKYPLSYRVAESFLTPLQNVLASTIAETSDGLLLA